MPSYKFTKLVAFNCVNLQSKLHITEDIFGVNTYIILISDVNACDFDLEVFDNLCSQFLSERVFLFLLRLL